MINFAVDPNVLEPHVPRGTRLDFHDGVAYVSLVGFLFQRTRLLGLPIPLHTHFEEVNLRFYVRRETESESRRGVVFLKELVPRFAIAALARAMYNEPYEAVPMDHSVAIPPGPQDRGHAEYRWRARGSRFSMRVGINGAAQALMDGSEEEFITEHYWGYTRQRDGSTIEYQVEHPRWRVWRGTESSIAGDFSKLYGSDFGSALAKSPRSAFVAEGSAVRVHHPNRLSPM